MSIGDWVALGRRGLRRWPRLALVVGTLGVWPGPLPAQTSEELTRRFLAEGPQGWEQYRAFCERLQGTVKGVFTVNGTTRDHYRIEFKSNSACKLCVFQSLLPGSSSGELYAFNPAYEFVLRRPSPEHPWLLTSLQMGSHKPDEHVWGSNLARLGTLIRTHTDELPELFRQPMFRVVRASPVTRDGRALVEIEFDNSHPLPRKGQKFFATQGGSLVLDPSHFWTLHSCDLRNKYNNGDAEIKIEIECVDALAKYPIPKRCVDIDELMSPMKGRLVGRDVQDFDLREASPVPPDAEFTLSAFGLPEPSDEPKVGGGRSRWYIWLELAAFGCILLALLCKRAARYFREKKTRPGAPAKG